MKNSLVVPNAIPFRLAAISFLLLIGAIGLRAQTISISNLWSISTAEGRPYLTNSSASSYTERGVAYNPLNNHAYIVSRAGTLRVAILEGDTGAEVGFLNVSGVTGGTFALSTIGVGDDGAIYGANLTTGSATSPYKIYRWANEGAAPVPVYSANPSGGANNNRYGESFDVRGSGVDTEIMASANGAAIVAIFKPTDATLGAFVSTRLDVSGIGAADLTKGIAFGPTNTFYGKNSGIAAVRFCRYDLLAGTGTLVTNYTVAAAIAPIDVDPVRNLLAGVESANAASPHNLRVYDLSSGSTPAQLFITAFPPPGTNNGNIVGEAQIAGDRIIGIDTQNGVVMAKIYSNTNPVPPYITQQPGNQTVIEGGYVTITATANGTRPLSFQWLHDSNVIAGATTNYLNLTNVALADAGNYSVIVTNIAGVTNSDNAILTVTPTVRSSVLSNIWRLPPGSRPWLTVDNNQRGFVYNPFTDHLLVVSRAPTNAIYVLDAATGAELYTLNVDPAIVTGGTFAINLIGVDGIGAIFAGNLTTGASSTPFKLYRWEFEEIGLPPTLVYSGDPANGGGGANSVRWGDSMDVRGDFPIQVLLGSRAGNQAAILSSVNGGTSFTSTPIVTDATNGDFGLSVSFGESNTFWGKALAANLRHIAFDVTTGTGTTLQNFDSNSFPSAASIIAVNPTNNYLAALSLETPDNIRFYEIQSSTNAPNWLDTEIFLTANANGNGTGALDFGGGKLFALDTNNGLMAFAIRPRLRWVRNGATIELSWDAPYVLQSSSSVNGAYTNVPGATSPFPVNTSAAPQKFFELKQ